MIVNRFPPASAIRALAVVVALAAAGVIAAQPPAYDQNRWDGFTAITPIQGYSQGSPLTLTWGFMALGTPINDSVFGGAADAPNNLQTRLDAIYGSQAVWQTHFQSIFDR